MRLLGDVELRHREAGLRRLPTRAATALLALLVLAAPRSMSREELIDLLWPQADIDAGRNRLRHTLSVLRRLLEVGGEPLIDADRRSLRLRPDNIDCDAVSFAELARLGAHEAARVTYGGDLLPGFYDEWVLEWRGRLQASYERVERCLAEAPSVQPPTDDPLPAVWTRTFGIEQSVARLARLVGSERLVCVEGPGGCGKTRLCLETARVLRAETTGRRETGFDRVVFVPLADCHDEAHALDALARAARASGSDTIVSLRAAFADWSVLLVLDNFEQLVLPASRLLLRLLEALPRLHLLVSSRRRLGLAGEQRFPLEGLPVPAPADGPDDLARNPAVALFFDRARSVRPDLQPDPHMLAAVGSLVRVVGGVPLALELAASRVGAQSPAQLMALLSGAAGGGCLPLLARAGPRAGYDPRHASIEEVIDWSWRLANPGQQALLAALSCFAGDAGLQALAAMRGEPPSRVVAELDELAGQSLLRVLPAPGCGGDEVRYALLEPVREFIRGRWPPQALRRLREALSCWLLQWAAGLSPAFEPARVARELRTVLHTLSQGVESPARALELALALRPHWESAGMPGATQQALADALAAFEAGAPDPMLASASHEMLANLAYEAGSTSVALEHAEAALRWAGTDGPLRARALVRRAFFDLIPLTSGAETQDPPARAWLDEALALARLHADREGQARALQHLAALARLCRADWSQADSLLAQAQALWLALGDRRKAVGRLIQRGHCWMRLGRVEEAQACFEQCERSARELDDVHGCIHSLLALSSLFEEGRRWHEALEVTRRCIDLCWQHQFLYPLGCVLWNMPVPLAHLRQPAEAMRLVAFASRFWQATYGPLTRNDRLSMRRVRRLVSAQLGTAAAETYWIDGACMDLPRAVALALQTDARDAAY